MLWLLVTILAYFFLAISVFGDKYLLTGGIPNPKVYSFYVGILSIFVFIFIPFGFFLPTLNQILLALLTGVIFITGLFLYYSVVKEFEASRVAPAIGGLVPIFVFLITYFFSRGGTFLSLKEIFIFLLLILGSVLITVEKSTDIFGKSFFLSSVTAFYFALYFVLAKFVYIPLGFINGFIWIRIGSFLVAPLFLFSREVRLRIFRKSQLTNFRTSGIFIGNQIMGSAGAVLQNWAVALIELSGVALVNAMQGVMYVFLFIFSLILSKKFPQILKEEISKKILIQKIIAILLIGISLAILAKF